MTTKKKMNEAAQFIQQEIGLKPGASAAALQALVESVPFALPNEYLDCLRASNGAEGSVGESGYLVLWSVEEVLERHRSYRVSDFAPGLLLIGGIGANAVFGIDGRNVAESGPLYVETDLIPMGWDDMFHTTHSLVAMFRHMTRDLSAE